MSSPCRRAVIRAVSWPGRTERFGSAEIAGDRIGQITTTGAITEFAVPTAGGAPHQLTAGPDGALWFPETPVNKIGRITTSGVITEFILPTAGSQPFDIAAGSDGNLWFVEQSANKIGRITPAGAVTEFAVPTANSTPKQIAAGPDGNLWFVENTGNKIGRTTIAGTITEFAIPTANSGPRGITAAPDGNLWFVENVANQIGRITPNGTVTEFPIPTGNSASKLITVGPDGTLWFAEQGANKIGRIAVPTSATSLLAAVLPLSRSVQICETATVFATIINAGAAPAFGCGILPVTSLPATFVYQTTDPATNALSGFPGTPANIVPGGSQSFVMALTPTAAFAPANVAFSFSCVGVGTAPTNSGVDTVLLSASATAVPDIVALAASGDPGRVDIPGDAGTGDFAVATANLGAAAQITASANTGMANLPVKLTICQTDPTSGVCLAVPAATVTTTIAPNATPTFGIFATGNGAVPFDPANNRVFVQFADSNGNVRGETSVVVSHAVEGPAQGSSSAARVLLYERLARISHRVP